MVPSLFHPLHYTFLPSYLEVVGSNPETPKNIFTPNKNEKIIPNKLYFFTSTSFFQFKVVPNVFPFLSTLHKLADPLLYLSHLS